jgi:hypothetical protein
MELGGGTPNLGNGHSKVGKMGLCYEVWIMDVENNIEQ